MKLYRQLIKAMLENYGAVPPNSLKDLVGFIFFRTELAQKRPYIADGDEFREVVLRNTLSNGVDEIGTNEGGTGLTLAEFNAGAIGEVLAKKNATEYEFIAAGGGGGADNFSWYNIPALTSVTIPTGQVMYLHEPITIDGTLTIDGKFTILP